MFLWPGVISENLSILPKCSHSKYICRHVIQNRLIRAFPWDICANWSSERKIRVHLAEKLRDVGLRIWQQSCFLLSGVGGGCTLGEYFVGNVTHCWVVRSHRAHSAGLNEESKLKQNMVYFSKIEWYPFLVLTTQANNSQLKKGKGWEPFGGLLLKELYVLNNLFYLFQRTCSKELLILMGECQDLQLG